LKRPVLGTRLKEERSILRILQIQLSLLARRKEAGLFGILTLFYYNLLEITFSEDPRSQNRTNFEKYK
jgi:hypothetical protein